MNTNTILIVNICFWLDVTYAFSVRLHEDTETNDNPVIFGNVDLNIGDGYDEFVGKSNNEVQVNYMTCTFIIL